ncbi:MAG: tetratricopeptide repeat protein, partial [Pedobacter sp.]
RNTIRWTYILAQLYDQQKSYEQALSYYTKVQKSNAGFELYFNANLNRIRLIALMNGQKINRKAQLLALLRDDKNSEYIDQIYYQIGEFFLESESYTEASSYYSRSVQASTKNAYQKGLSYLKLADLNFKYFKNYLKAKTYYDSTVAVLPKSYQGYDLILKKDQNLEYLTKRYEQITLQDTLQDLAKIPEGERRTRVEQILAPALMTDPAPTAAGTNFAPDPALPATNLSRNATQVSGSTFYFSNATALSKGFSDFRKKWGNRKLEDNWRQSIRVAAQANTQNTLSPGNAGLALNPDDASPGTTDNKSQVDAYLASIPVNPVLLESSNQKIIDSYFEIASFYQQELNDQEEAIRVYEELLTRFPENKYLAAINYSLFLAYKNTNEEKAAFYRNVILSKYGSSIYAKTILDPGFNIKQNEFDAIVNKKYNDLFDLYAAKDFPKVIVEADRLIADYPNNFLAPQFAYLRAIAIGRTSYVDNLITALSQIKASFPADQFIVPLVNENLAYLEQHLAEFKKRKIALLDFDPNEPRFMGQAPAVIAQQPLEKIAQKPIGPVPQQQTAVVPSIPAVTKPTISELPASKPAEINPTIVKAAVKKDNIFSTEPATMWYYVVDVADASLTLSSSRFGIGQFNRGNYPDHNLRHQLKEFDDDQLIYVGNFSSFEDVKNYASGITPQLKQIMKVPETIYSSFVISKENFDKLKSRALVIQYLEFYKNNYSNE